MNFLRQYFSRQTRQVGELCSRLGEIEDQLKRLADSRRIPPPVVIEHAERVIIEKVDYGNHFDTLDITKLEGQVNIGLNYQGVRPADEPFPVLKGLPLAPAKEAGHDPGAASKKEENIGPRYNIKSRKSKTAP